jgi:hypothetical protein
MGGSKLKSAEARGPCFVCGKWGNQRLGLSRRKVLGEDIRGTRFIRMKIVSKRMGKQRSERWNGIRRNNMAQ